jgi:hypothetical protein
MIKLIWQCNKENSWESDWLEFLFQDIRHETVTDYQQQLHCMKGVVIYNSTTDIKSYLDRVGSVYGLIHLSDEWSKDSTDHYSRAKFVLRNYYKDLGSNVLNFPLGWMSTYSHDLPVKSVQDRTYTWSFTGHVDKTTRPQMAEHMSQVPNGRSYFKKCGENWGTFQGQALTPSQMAEMYNDSIFVPCPQGNCSIDTFRVTEALQMGALPIVEKNPYWEQLFGDNPLIQIKHWDEAPGIINTLMSNKDALELMRQDTHRWWIKHCAQVKLKIRNLINENS